MAQYTQRSQPMHRHSNWLIKTLRGVDTMNQVQTVCEDHIDPNFLRIIRRRNITFYDGESKKENASDTTNEPQPGPSGANNEDITDKSVPGADSSTEPKDKVSKFEGTRKRINKTAIKSEPVDEEPAMMEQSDETGAPELDATQEIAEARNKKYSRADKKCAKRARVHVDAQEETAVITTTHIITPELIIKEDPEVIEGPVTPMIYEDIALKQVKLEYVKVNVKQEISEFDTTENVNYHDSLGYQNLPTSANDNDSDSIDSLIKSELKTNAQVNEGPLEISDNNFSERQCVPLLTNVLEYLLEENYINKTEYVMLAKYKSEFHLLYDRSECLEPKLIYFAVALYVCSHKAYEYIFNNYKTALLPASSLRDRMVNMRGHSGFTRETLEAINDMTTKRNSNTYVCLVLKDLKVVSKGAQTSKFRSSNPLEWSIGSADAAVVFTAVALNAKWKLPIGYFWTNSIKGIERANLVKVAIGTLETVGVEPVAVSFEYSDENIKMCDQLDCTIDKLDSRTFFLSESNRPIYIFPDPRNILEVIYKDISYDDEFIDGADKIVSVAQLPLIIEHLKTIPPDQLLKKVVASELVKNAFSTIDPSSEYRIIIFLKYLHIVLDILACWKRGLKWKATPNSNTTEGGGMFVTALREANQYFKSLKSAQTMIPLCETDKGRGLLALCSLIDSALMIIFKYSHFPIEFGKFIVDPSYFLANLMSRYNRTTPVNFLRAYRNMLKNISYRRHEQCLGIEDLHLLRKKPVDKINLTTYLPNGNTVWHVKDDFWKLNLGHETVKEYADEFMMYIARFVTYCLARQLHCETCIRAIRAEKANTKAIKMPSSSKIASKVPRKINALRLRKFIEKLEDPSPTVIDICKYSEFVFRKASNLKQHSTQNIPSQLIKVMKRYVNRPLFENIIDHQLDAYETCNHLVELAKAVAKVYLETRVYHSEKSLARESAISNQKSKPTTYSLKVR